VYSKYRSCRAGQLNFHTITLSRESQTETYFEKKEKKKKKKKEKHTQIERLITPSVQPRFRPVFILINCVTVAKAGDGRFLSPWLHSWFWNGQLALDPLDPPESPLYSLTWAARSPGRRWHQCDRVA